MVFLEVMTYLLAINCSGFCPGDFPASETHKNVTALLLTVTVLTLESPSKYAKYAPSYREHKDCAVSVSDYHYNKWQFYFLWMLLLIEIIRNYELPCKQMLIESSGVMTEQFLSPQGAVEEQVVACVQDQWTFSFLFPALVPHSSVIESRC